MRNLVSVGRVQTHTHTDGLNKRTILLNMLKINKDSKYNPGDDSG